MKEKGLIRMTYRLRSANSTMAGCKRKVLEPSSCSIQGWMSQLVNSIHWNLKVGAHASEGMDLIAGKDQKLSSFMSIHFKCIYIYIYTHTHRLLAESLAQSRNGFAQLKSLGIKGMSLTNLGLKT